MTVPSLEEIRRAPKALLHDHLDGGHRPATMVELAAETGYSGLPTTDPDDLGRWMARAAARHSLELYIETFVHTIGITQTPDAIARVAAECAEDLAADGVVYAEVRFAPELHTQRGLSMDEVVRSVLAGFAEGSRGRNIRIVGLLCAMRSAAHSLEVAEVAVRHRDAGIVGFDIAGAEAGYPPTRHLAAFQYLQRANFHFTIHAGRASACRPSGRLCSTAAPSASGMECASPRTSAPISTGSHSSGVLPPSCGTAASPSSCAPAPTSTPG